MKFILLLLIAVGVGAYFLPAQQESTATACGALETRVRRLAEAELAKLPQVANPKAQGAITTARTQIPGGAAIEAIIREKLPFLPHEVGCAAGYWATVYQPDLRQLVPGLLPPRS